jgi:hypothetical protein
MKPSTRTAKRQGEVTNNRVRKFRMQRRILRPRLRRLRARLRIPQICRGNFRFGSNFRMLDMSQLPVRLSGYSFPEKSCREETTLSVLGGNDSYHDIPFPESVTWSCSEVH